MFKIMSADAADPAGSSFEFRAGRSCENPSRTRWVPCPSA